MKRIVFVFLMALLAGLVISLYTLGPRLVLWAANDFSLLNFFDEKSKRAFVSVGLHGYLVHYQEEERINHTIWPGHFYFGPLTDEFPGEYAPRPAKKSAVLQKGALLN